MARRHKPPESAHAMRWMVSYADFITLLFAFFVVMYAISSVNNKKFDQVTEVLSGIFEQAPKSWQPIQLEAIFNTVVRQSGSAPQDVSPIAENTERAMADLIAELETLAESESLHLFGDSRWIQLEVPADKIFNKHRLTMSASGEALINKLAKKFTLFGNPINVEVFADEPISRNADLTDPWELTAVQAAHLVQLLILENVKPSRLAAVGYGQYQPIATNDDEEGRALNRRVVFLIDSAGKQRERIKIVTKRHLSAMP